MYCYLCCVSEVHCGSGFYIRSLVRDLGIGKKFVIFFMLLDNMNSHSSVVEVVNSPQAVWILVLLTPT